MKTADMLTICEIIIGICFLSFFLAVVMPAGFWEFFITRSFEEALLFYIAVIATIMLIKTWRKNAIN